MKSIVPHSSFIRLTALFIEFELLKSRIIRRSNEEDRDDDNLNVVQTRYDAYLRTTLPVSRHYQTKYPLIFNEINGNDEIDKITSKIKKILEKS